MNQDLIIRTPLLPFEALAPNNSHKIFLKPENLQRFGSYKMRGVAQAIRVANPKTLSGGLYAASAGNMAQAVAYMAKELQLNCTIYVPETAPEIKKLAIQKLGAHLEERPFEKIWELVRNPPKLCEGLFIHPVFTPGLLEGYGSIADELVVDRPSLHSVLIPFGVGGLTLGIARRLKFLNPKIKIYAVEVESACPLKASLLAGKAMKIKREPTFVDAIGTPEVLNEIFEELQFLITDSLVVSLGEVRKAISHLALQNKLICEGAAAAALTAAHKLSQQNPLEEMACILTGGNISKQTLNECMK